MAAPTVRSTAGGLITDGIGIEPPGAAQNDIIVMFFHNTTDSVARTPPTGWTEHIDQTYIPGGYDRMCCFTIKRGGTAPSYSVTGGNGGSSAIFTIAIQGADLTTWIDAAPTGAASNGTAPASPSITTVTADTLLLTSAGNDANGSATNLTAPTGFTKVGTDKDFACAYKANAPTGATGTLAWASGNFDWGMMTVAIRPAAAAAPSILPPFRNRVAVHRAANW